MSKAVTLLFIILTGVLLSNCGSNTSPSNYLKITEYKDTVEFRGLTSYSPERTEYYAIPNYPNSTLTVAPLSLESGPGRSNIILRLNKKDYQRNIEDSKYWPEKGLPSGEQLPAKLGDGVGNGFKLPGIQIDGYGNGKLVIYQKNRKFGMFVPEKEVFNVKDIFTFSWTKDNYKFKASIIGPNDQRYETGVVLLFPEINQ